MSATPDFLEKLRATLKSLEIPSALNVNMKNVLENPVLESWFDLAAFKVRPLTISTFLKFQCCYYCWHLILIRNVESIMED